MGWHVGNYCLDFLTWNFILILTQRQLRMAGHPFSMFTRELHKSALHILCHLMKIDSSVPLTTFLQADILLVITLTSGPKYSPLMRLEHSRKLDLKTKRQ